MKPTRIRKKTIRKIGNDMKMVTRTYEDIAYQIKDKSDLFRFLDQVIGEIGEINKIEINADTGHIKIRRVEINEHL